MRRVQRVAEQDDVAVVPVLVADHREAAPGRAIGDEPMPLQEMRPQILQVGDGLGLAQVAEGRFRLGPGRLRRFDHPGAHVAPVLVGAEVPDAEFVGREVERESVRGRRAAEPDEMIAAQLEGGLEVLLVAGADEAVDAVGRDDQVDIGELVEIADLARELELDADIAAARLQHHQQGAALGAAEAVTGGAHDLAVEMEVDLVPIGELAGDRRVGLRVVVHRDCRGSRPRTPHRSRTCRPRDCARGRSRRNRGSASSSGARSRDRPGRRR